MTESTTEFATIGGGCYWCLDALYRRVNGVTHVTSGYSGGTFPNPSSQDVYNGGTGHAEVVHLAFDPAVISYTEILEIFFTMHDPTTLNRQGYDIGEIYRSVILYHSDSQKQIAQNMIEQFAPTLWDDPIVTQLVPFEKFWPADPNMQEYYDNNPRAGYCMSIINPKVVKLRQKFAAKLKAS